MIFTTRTWDIIVSFTLDLEYGRQLYVESIGDRENFHDRYIGKYQHDPRPYNRNIWRHQANRRIMYWRLGWRSARVSDDKTLKIMCDPKSAQFGRGWFYFDAHFD